MQKVVFLDRDDTIVKNVPYCSRPEDLHVFDFSGKAIKKLKDEFPEIHLIVIGKIKKNGHTQRLIEKLKIKEKIFFKSNITKAEITDL